MPLTQKIGQVITLSTLIFGSFIPAAFSANTPQETIQKLESQTLLAQKKGSAYVCTNDRYGYLRLRAYPSLKSRIIGRINNRQNLTVLRSKGNWYKIRNRGRIGWVSGDYVCSRGGSVGRNSRKCNNILASIKNRMDKRRIYTINRTHDYRNYPANRKYFVYYYYGFGNTVGKGDGISQKSIASQIIYNCKTIGFVGFGGYDSGGVFVTDVFGINSSGRMIRFQCLNRRRGRNFKPRWGQALCY